MPPSSPKILEQTMTSPAGNPDDNAPVDQPDSPTPDGDQPTQPVEPTEPTDG